MDRREIHANFRQKETLEDRNTSAFYSTHTKSTLSQSWRILFTRLLMNFLFRLLKERRAIIYIYTHLWIMNIRQMNIILSPFFTSSFPPYHKQKRNSRPIGKEGTRGNCKNQVEFAPCFCAESFLLTFYHTYSEEAQTILQPSRGRQIPVMAILVLNWIDEPQIT